jgi:hypothetical protein
MSFPARKSVRDIRTRTSLTSEEKVPQRKFLKLANLELKRALCNTVRDTARQRVEEMDKQLAEIAAEQARVLSAIRIGLGTSPECGTPRAANGLTVSGRRGLTIQYGSSPAPRRHVP